MSELKVLSKDEVDALLNLTRDGNTEMSALENQASVHGESWVENSGQINSHALTNIKELCVAECENIFTSFLRKKIIVKFKSANHVQLSECITDKMEKHVFSVFQLTPSEEYGMVAIDLALLHHSITLLYGGMINSKDQIIETPGKIGIIIAEKLCELALDGFKKACSEFGEVSYKVLKTMTLPNLTSKLDLEDHVYAIEMIVVLGEIETSLCLLVTEDFLEEFIPVKPEEVSHIDSNFWRTAIETQVVDSFVSLSMTLPEINIKVNDLNTLKDGDLIPLTDPTAVYVCLNNLKLFRAKAGQANSKRVVKIVSEI